MKKNIHLKLDKFDIVIIDFDGVLTDNKVSLSENGNETVVCNRSDGLGINILKKLKKKIYIFSSEKNKVVKLRANKLKIPCITGVSNKKKSLISFFYKNKFDFNKTLYIGNDINDYHAMKLCKYKSCPKDSHKLILNISNYISNKNGGEGILIDIIENYLKIALVNYC